MFSRFVILIIIFFNTSCVEKTTYSGLIINENIKNMEFNNKTELLHSLGKPNYIDPLENKYYYYTEEIRSKNLLSKK